jgi:hypothetical protein
MSELTSEQFVRLQGISCYAIHSKMDIGYRDRLKERFNRFDDIDVLVLSYLCSNEGLNLHYRCHNSIMVEQGISYASEHQAWSRVRRIGQRFIQRTERLVNLDTIDVLIENAQRDRQAPMLYALGVMERFGVDVDSDEVFDTLIGNQHPVVLRDLVIGNIGHGDDPHSESESVEINFP